MQAYSYVRFSTPDQAKGDSLRRQLERSRRYAATKGLDLDDSLRDLGTSAFHNRHADTGHLSHFLEHVRGGKVPRGSYFLVESLDRLSRDEFWPAFDLIRDLLKAGIVLVTLPAHDDPREYSLDNTNRNPALINEIIFDLTRSHRESKVKSERCAEVAAQQRVAARTGNVKIPGRTHAWLQPIRLEVDGKAETVGFQLKPQAAIIPKLFEMAIGGMGERLIAQKLNEAGEPGLTGKGWHHSTVKHILRSIAVYGAKQPGKMVGGERTPDGAVIEGYYPALVDEGTFLRAAAARKQRKHRAAGRKGKLIANLFSGFCRCGQCGSALLYVDKGYRQKVSSSVFLQCTAARRRFACDNTVHYHYKPLERAILGALTLFDVTALLDRPPAADADRGAELEAAISVKAERVRRLAAIGNLEEVEDVIVSLSGELKELRLQLDAHRANAKLAEAEASRNAHTEFCRLVDRMHAGELPDEGAYATRARLAQHLRRISERLVTDGRNIVLELKTPDGSPPAELRFTRTDTGYELAQLPLWTLAAMPDFKPPVAGEHDPHLVELLAEAFCGGKEPLAEVRRRMRDGEPEAALDREVRIFEERFWAHHFRGGLAGIKEMRRRIDAGESADVIINDYLELPLTPFRG